MRRLLRFLKLPYSQKLLPSRNPLQQILSSLLKTSKEESESTSPRTTETDPTEAKAVTEATTEKGKESDASTSPSSKKEDKKKTAALVNRKRPASSEDRR